MNTREMPCPPEQYADKPNLWRLACELATFKEPYKAMNSLLGIIKVSAKKEGAA